ncbi:MAG: hypothetical protein HUK20_12130 [Fibrobacter sp.]|nr:hypothetical protein [Fibrobacter sp.]
MNRFKFFAAVASIFAAQTMAADAIMFVPEVYSIGEVNQGDVKHVVLKGANVSGKTIKLENVMGQGIGMSNFKFPSEIRKNDAVKIEFDIDFSLMEGPVNPVVVLVGTDGKPYTATLEGTVKAPFFFGEKMFDAGYYQPGEKREWTFYVWETDKKGVPDLVLDSNSAREFSIKTKRVKLNVNELDKIREGGKVPGLKVTLSTKGLLREGYELKQQSIRKIVTFKSKKFPKATPEVLVIGYWK